MPNGLKLNLKVHVGNNNRLQEAVNRILTKTPMEITLLLAEEHSLQLLESKMKMTELEEELRANVDNEG